MPTWNRTDGYRPSRTYAGRPPQAADDGWAEAVAWYQAARRDGRLPALPRHVNQAVEILPGAYERLDAYVAADLSPALRRQLGARLAWLRGVVEGGCGTQGSEESRLPAPG